MSYRKSEVVEYTGDLNDLSDRFIRRKETVELDKTALKAALKEGIKIAGASLIKKQNVQIK